LTDNIRHEAIIILDFGGQYTQLIARRVREAGVYCEILPCPTPLAEIRARQPKGLILSGSPASVYQSDAPRPAGNLLEAFDCPLLGICYGFQVLAFDLGGEVRPSPSREFGYARLEAQLRSAQAGAGDAVLFSVLGAVQDFAAACPLADDMSLAIVRRDSF